MSIFYYILIMGNKSITQLTKERDRLLKKFDSVEDKLTSTRLQNQKKRKLESEIRALKHPRSTIAVRSFFNSARKATLSTGSFIKKRAKILDENLKKQEREEHLRMNRKQKTTRKTTKKKTAKKR